MNLSLSEKKVREHCRANGLGVSALEPLPGGGVRLVCSSGEGAALLRVLLKNKLIADDTERTRFSPDRPHL
jgi:hypothetical protein